MAQIEPLTAQKRMPTAENPELLEQTRLLNRTNFAVPARKMPTNGKRLRAEMAESQFAKTQNKNLNQEEKAQRLASPAKAGIGGEKPKGQKSQWCESHQKRRPTPLLSGGSGVGWLL